ncbi:AlpA family phage regulatory protein [Alcanivorax sp. PA15-N-34]|uniref:AlpA family phage regulatory protein n=1 Tax=Alcanivorax sediminis TaxID=2663008 RepID=A0A6N7LX11_9GAMM|nr:helix-turn-helix domain-containing protein [Alcanivorax sediminis]MQX53926.1 AlpA family phage regulatory protein [Alcanivorax sediminis]
MKYLSDKQTADRYEVSRATWWRWVREGHAPKPVKLSPGCTRWKLVDLESWESAQEAQA